MHKTSSLINAFELGSQAVYPLASKVALRPPEGKDEASPSPLIRFLPVKLKIALPESPSGTIKLSCFSEVVPFKGWNQ